MGVEESAEMPAKQVNWFAAGIFSVLPPPATPR
jgi:hypothetical protein